MSVLEEHPWQTLNGNEVEDIRDKIKEYCSNGKYTLHIGSDTKPHSDSTTLITTICFREQSKGAVVFYQKQKIKFFTNVLERLLHEVAVSLQIAEEVREATGISPTIHADVNPSEQNLSNRVADAIMGMIKGMGYPVLIKPDAWAADIADMYTR